MKVQLGNHQPDYSRFSEQSLPSAVSITTSQISIDTISSAAPAKEPVLESKKQSSFFGGFLDWIKNIFSPGNTKEAQAQEANQVHHKETMSKVIDEMKEVNRRTKEIDEEFEALQSQARFEALLKKLQELHEKDNPYRALAILLKMLVILQNGQGELKENDNLLLIDQIQRKQGNLKTLQQEKTRIHEDYEKITDKMGFYKKVNKVLTGISFALTGTATALAAASLATLGISGVVSIVVHAAGGVVSLLKAGNTLLNGLTDREMKKTEAKSLEVTETRKLVQYTLKVNVQDVEKNMKDLTRFNEALAELLRAEYEAGRFSH